MRLDKFDLNLLVALDVLFEEQNVTRTAERLGLTQSGVSAALSRLRMAFGDDLLVQHGKRMMLTAHARALRPEITRTIAQLRALIAQSGTFDPAQSTRTFRVAASDYITAVLFPPLLGHLARVAPGICLEIILPHAGVTTELANGDLDLVFTPVNFTHPQHPHEVLLEERHVVVGWHGNPLMNAPMTDAQFLGAAHVGVSITGKSTYIETILAEQGSRRSIEIVVPSFLQAPFLVPGTMRLCVMHERLAKIMTQSLPLAIAELPIDVRPMAECIQYHSSRQGDPGLLWLRGELRTIAATL